MNKQRPRKEALLKKPHIALWKSGPPPDRRDPDRAWYFCLNWEEKNVSCQVSISNHSLHKNARAGAIRCGKKYNLPVLQHNPVDFIVIWTPTKKSTVKNKKAVKELQNSKQVIKFASAFQ